MKTEDLITLLKLQDELDKFLRLSYISNFRTGFPKSVTFKNISSEELDVAKKRIGKATNTWMEVYYKQNPLFKNEMKVCFVPGKLI